jgi:hypothetical protein
MVIGTMVGTFLLVQAPWAHPLRTLALLSIPAGQGVLTGKQALRQSCSTRLHAVIANVELVCARLLGVAAGMAVLGAQSLPVIYSSWVVAAIATLLLVLAAALDLLQAMARRQNQRPRLVKLLLQSLALIFYSFLLLWMWFLLVRSLAGESYMGN